MVIRTVTQSADTLLSVFYQALDFTSSSDTDGMGWMSLNFTLYWHSMEQQHYSSGNNLPF